MFSSTVSVNVGINSETFRLTKCIKGGNVAKNVTKNGGGLSSLERLTSIVLREEEIASGVVSLGNIRKWCVFRQSLQ